MKKRTTYTLILLCIILFNGLHVRAQQAKETATNKDVITTELSGFSVKSQNNTILVSFGTSHEFDNEQFVIQRSSDNTNWNDIGLIHGTGGGLWPVSYCFVDTNINETLLYYRITIVNGKKQEHSEVISVSPVVEQDAAQFLVYPNPARGSVWVKSLQPGNLYMDLFIFNSRGEQVYTSKLREGSQRIDLSDFKPGYYYVKTGTQIHKIYKE